MLNLKTSGGRLTVAVKKGKFKFNKIFKFMLKCGTNDVFEVNPDIDYVVKENGKMYNMFVKFDNKTNTIIFTSIREMEEVEDTEDESYWNGLKCKRYLPPEEAMNLIEELLSKIETRELEWSADDEYFWWLYRKELK